MQMGALHTPPLPNQRIQNRKTWLPRQRQISIHSSTESESTWVLTTRPRLRNISWAPDSDATPTCLKWSSPHTRHLSNFPQWMTSRSCYTTRIRWSNQAPPHPPSTLAPSSLTHPTEATGILWQGTSSSKTTDCTAILCKHRQTGIQRPTLRVSESERISKTGVYGQGVYCHFKLPIHSLYRK